MGALREAAQHVLWFNMGREGVEPPAEVREVLLECAGAIRRADRAALEQLEDEHPMHLAVSCIARMPGGLQDLERMVLQLRELERRETEAAAAPGGISLMQ